MPRSIQQKCLECAFLSMEEVHGLHGQQGDGCWEPSLCRSKRSVYRNRDRTLKKRREKYVETVGAQIGLADQEIEALKVSRHALYVTMYQDEGHQGEPHAIEARVWIENEIVAFSEPRHCFGMTQDDLRKYVLHFKHRLQTESQITINTQTKFINLPTAQCPIRPCPLHPETWTV